MTIMGVGGGCDRCHRFDGQGVLRIVSERSILESYLLNQNHSFG